MATWRRFPRGTLRGVAQLSGPFGRATGELTELSIGGCFVAGIAALRGGTRVRAHLLLPRDSRPVDVMSRVLYSRPASSLSLPGIGIALDDLRAEDAERIAGTVERCDLLHMGLLFRLEAREPDREEIDRLCLEAGIPTGLPLEDVLGRVGVALRRYRGE